MFTLGSTRRIAVAAWGASALLAAVAGQNAFAQSGLAIRNIRVDVAPLRANVGDPTASWVQERLPDQLAHALAGRLTSQGGTLVVRIDYVSLGPIKDSSARDNISGVAKIGSVQWRFAGAPKGNPCFRHEGDLSDCSTATSRTSCRGGT